ncbi:MAG TPA: hypothetical protein VL475_11800 [Planctomycetaceae bacterium]|nr:hypothetical protein [Planctomycetaceae bacterium]
MFGFSSTATIQQWQPTKLARLAIAALIAMGAGQARAESKSPIERSAEPAFTVVLPSVDMLYDDLKFVFDLAKDEKGYKTFRDTLDVYFEGVERDRSGTLRVFVGEEGLRTILSAPVKSEADYKKFVENLWDLDIKTDPPPTPAQLPQVPRDIQNRQKTLHLQPSERIVFGLYDAFLKHGKGQVHLGTRLEDVRAMQGELPKLATKGDRLEIRLNGEQQSPDVRHRAFAKSKDSMLSDLTRDEDETEADFALRRALVAHQLGGPELLFSEARTATAGWTLLREKKKATLRAEVTGAKDTSLAKTIAGVGEHPDLFSGVAKAEAVLLSSVNAPIPPARSQSMGEVIRQARRVASEKIADSRDLDDRQKKFDQDLADFAFDVTDDIISEPVLNSVLRIWSGPNGALTTVGGARVADGQKFVERLHKLRGRSGQEAVELSIAKESGAEIHRLRLAGVPADFQELFDRDGTMYVATAANAVWFALGVESLERLKHALHEASQPGKKSSSALAFEARLGPLAQAWDRIHSRRKKDAPSKADANDKKAKPEKSETLKGKVTHAKSVLSDLNLQEVAVHAFQAGQDNLSLAVDRKGESLALTCEVDEGFLRFVGEALSKFVKENLED